MKRIAIALLAGVAGLAGTSARADSRVSIGINVGVPAYRSAPPLVIVAPQTRYYAPPPVVYVPAPAPRGYWKEVQVKTWVPERWIVRPNRWGHSERYCEPGHFVFRTERVWVENHYARSYHDARDQSGYYRRSYR